MNETSFHWGSLNIGTADETRSPLRSLITTQLSDTRAFVDRLFADYTASGRRAVAARLLESGGNLPWFIAASKLGRLTKR